MVAAVALPRILRIGAGASAALPEALAVLGLSRPLIVTDRFLIQRATARIDGKYDDQNFFGASMFRAMDEAGLVYRVFADAVPDPTVASIEAALNYFDQGEHDCVVGFGGGSPIDTAKMVAVMAVHGGPVSRFKTPHVQDAPGLPILAVPTTAGTGSEATRFAVITDEVTDEKMLCAGLAYLPTAALVDYELTLSKPARLTADTGIDSLTHAIEAYVSKRANPFSDGFALSAMRRLAPNLRRVCEAPHDRAAREAMMLGATEAGIAFSNASVALVHGMSRPIGAHFHVPHGLSNAMLLPVVTAWSAPSALDRYGACARAMGVASEDEGCLLYTSPSPRDS